MTAAATVTMTDARQSDSRTPERGLYLRRAWRRGGGAKPLIGRHCARSNQEYCRVPEPKSRTESGFEESIDRGWSIHQRDWQSVPAPPTEHRASHRKGRQPLHPMDPIHLNLNQPFVSWHVEMHPILVFQVLYSKLTQHPTGSAGCFEGEGKLRF